jgi:hypothetical protein
MHPSIKLRATMLLLGLAMPSQAQQTINGSRTLLGNWDASTAATTKPIKAGTAIPASCGVGEMFFKTDAAAGANLYLCTAVNAWTQVQGGVPSVFGRSGLVVALTGDYSFSQISGTASAAQLPASVTYFQTGAGAPPGACTAGQNLYLDTTNLDYWFCDVSNAWKKFISTTNSGPFSLVGQTGTAPATPAAGMAAMYLNSADKTLHTVNDAGLDMRYAGLGESNVWGAFLQDFSGASHTLPAAKGTIAGKPATCAVGEEYFATDAAAGLNMFYCTATNTWTQQTSGGSYSQVQSPSGSNLTQRNTLIAGDRLSAADTGSATRLNANPFDASVFIEDDDFLYNACGQASAAGAGCGKLAWVTKGANNGTIGTAAAPGPTDWNHPGILQLDSSATVNGRASINLGSSSAGYDTFDQLDVNTNWEFWFIFKLPVINVTNSFMRVCLSDSNLDGNSCVTSSIVVEFAPTTSANYQVTTCNASSTCAARASLGLAATSTNWFTVRIRSTAAGIALASVAADGGAFSSEVSIGAGQTVNQALPSSKMSPKFVVDNGGTASSVQMYVDYWAGKIAGLTRPRIY